MAASIIPPPHFSARLLERVLYADINSALSFFWIERFLLALRNALTLTYSLLYTLPS